jgi:hypothetical protein
MSNNTTSYDAWTNEETWLTHKWLTEDKASRRHWQERTSTLVAKDEGPAAVNQAIHQLASEIREAVESECRSYVAMLSDDLLSCALARVVWREIAKVIFSDRIPAAADFDWLFPFGNIVETAGVLKQVSRQDRLAAVAQHARGNWGEVEGVDWSENDCALRNGERLYSEYRSNEGGKFLIITTGDRSITTVLLAEEY